MSCNSATMLKRAVDSHLATANKTVQEYQQRPIQTALHGVTTQKSSHTQPLDLKSPNTFRPPPTNTLKRKYDRTLSTMSNTSSLSQLHGQVFFNENDFDDDDSIDLDYSVQSRKPPTPVSKISYPSIDSVVYPELPPEPPLTQMAIQSSAPVPWSSSPDSHWAKPQQITVPPVLSRTASPEPVEQYSRPTKRRTLPWQKTSNQIPDILPQDGEDGERYPWNKSAAAVKSEQKELRKKYAAKVAQPKLTHDKQVNVPATHLSDEQQAVAKAVVDDGKSVFFTGSAGTGKSVLMRSIIARLRKKYTREADRLAITASTGLAACVIEGTTLHSWAGIGLGKEPVQELVKKIKRNAKTKTKWLRTKVLVVDEISMVDGDLFDKLEAIARAIRNNGRPFGGIQLVVTGDFFQLPPVPEKNAVAKFAFDAATWNTCIQHTILLTHIFRQKDPQFAGMLNEMRLGKLSNESIRAFQKLSRPLEFADELDATELFPTRGEVDSANTSRMMRLSGQEQNYPAVDSGISDVNVRNKILANFMAPENLVLKKGAQVMLIKNIDTQLVNGTLGKIVAFMDESCYAAYKDDEETYHLAHEPEGGSDEEEKAAARKRFSIARYKNKDGPATRYWPMVRFPLADGTCRDMLCMPEEWKTENQQGEITAKRVQVPLILAWALSIHKAQGQTLSRVKVDLGKVFEKGQAYVALSRATSQAGLQVLRFDARKVMVHPKVINFYQKLVSIDSVIAKAEKKGNASGNDHERQYIFVDENDDELFMYG